MDKSTFEFKLPGFRFHPTEEELLSFYLKSMVLGEKRFGNIIGLLNIYNHDPRELPGLARIGEREWYFFVPRNRKHGNGGRPNRTTEHGFWKATGSDRKISSLSDPKKTLGLRKTLVFYEGRAPRGRKTDWVMNEYRLPNSCSTNKDIVLCKIYRKATSLKELEQRATVEEVKTVQPLHCWSSPTTSSMDTVSFGNLTDDMMIGEMDFYSRKEDTETFAFEDKHVETFQECRGLKSCNSLVFPIGNDNLAELEVPKFTTDWNQDFCTPLLSPWFDNFATLTSALNC